MNILVYLYIHTHPLKTTKFDTQYGERWLVNILVYLYTHTHTLKTTEFDTQYGECRLLLGIPARKQRCGIFFIVCCVCVNKGTLAVNILKPI